MNMYIFELFNKLKKGYKNKQGIFSSQAKEDAEHEGCSHIFVPIDSTKEILACSKCGFLIHRKDIPKIKNKNFFIQE